ncbi:MAG: type II toxin-antitoxin system VapC family toxin [Verrucomicrobia bacterium]|nr:type II toxin-antitoxin system VapC family toxin [Verrucomicrobiota bacterium]
MSSYFDTALFVKAYVLEADSAEAIAILETVGEPFAYSHLHAIEIPNAIRLKRFRGEITLAQENAALRAFRGEVDAGRFLHIDYDLPSVFKRAEELSSRFSGELGTRSLDLWHVAAALEAGCTAFASYDARQRRAAALCKLKLVPATTAAIK